MEGRFEVGLGEAGFGFGEGMVVVRWVGGLIGRWDEMGNRRWGMESAGP